MPEEDFGVCTGRAILGPSELKTISIRQQSSSTYQATPEDFQYRLPTIIAAGVQEKKSRHTLCVTWIPKLFVYLF